MYLVILLIRYLLRKGKKILEKSYANLCQDNICNEFFPVINVFCSSYKRMNLDMTTKMTFLHLELFLIWRLYRTENGKFCAFVSYIEEILD